MDRFLPQYIFFIYAFNKSNLQINSFRCEYLIRASARHALIIMLHDIEDLTHTTISILGGGNGSLFNFSHFNHSCSLALCECNISDNSSNGLCE